MKAIKPSYYNTHFKFSLNEGTDLDHQTRNRIYYNYLQDYISDEKLLKSSICDIGCSTGNWLEFITNKRNINATGVDNDKKSISIAKKRLHGVTFINTSAITFVSECIKKQQKFDLITMINTLEHLDSREVLHILRNIKNILNKDAILFIVVPNAGTIYNNHWLYDDITHKTNFTVRSFSQLLRICEYDNFTFINDSNSYLRGKSRIFRRLIFYILNIIDWLIMGKSINRSFQYPTFITLIKT